MTENPDADNELSDDRTATDSSTDSGIDGFLDRFEETLDSEIGATEIPSSDSQSKRHSQSDRAIRPDQHSQSDQSTTADQATRSTTADQSDGGRLWDEFLSKRGGDSQPAAPPEQPSETTTTHTDEPDPRSAVDDHSGPSSESTPPSESSEPDRSPSTDPVMTEEPADTVPDEPSTDTATNEPTSTAVDSARSSSFGGLLNRLSHRIGSVTGSESSTESAATASAETQDSASTGSGSTDRTTLRDGSSSDRRSQSETIEQILNNIDMYGRATSSSQVLLLSPTAHSITNEIYQRFLLPDDGSGQNVLFVSATQSAGDQLAAAGEIPSWMDGETAVIEVGQGGLRQASGPDRIAQLSVYKQLSNLRNLAKLGVNISHIVSQWNPNRRPTVVGVHTLSAIQQYVGNETMFQFLFTLKGQLNSMGVMGFYHMDPSAHTNNEISTIQSAFDIVVTVSPDGSVDIQ